VAGIGFELYKILQKGTLSSIVQAFFLGIIIIAGPWILSVLTIYIIQRYAYMAIGDNPSLFTVSIVYVYAFSLFFTGGLHYVFSRYIADMVFIENYDDIPPALLTAIILVMVVSIIPVVLFILCNDFSFINHTGVYIVSLTSLFIIINILWLLLVYISLLKVYYKIFFSYLTGTIASIVGVYYFGSLYGVAGALAGYTVGQAIIVVLLLAISQTFYPVKKVTMSKSFLKSFKEHNRIFLMGCFFNMAIWSDKMLYWFFKGKNISNTLYYYCITYDIPVFLAYLTMIPGLVYFLIVVETDFHKYFTDFIKNILDDSWRYIQIKKNKMLLSLKNGIKGLIFFQSIFTIALLLKIDTLLNISGYSQTVDINILRILIIAVFFHMLTLNLMLYLLYLELQSNAATAACIYLLLNVVGTIVAIFYTNWLPGTSYLFASFVAAIYCGYHLYKKAPIIDFIIFSRT